jgi:hypothetical protein
MGQYLKDYIEYCLPRRSCVWFFENE